MGAMVVIKYLEVMGIIISLADMEQMKIIGGAIFGEDGGDIVIGGLANDVIVSGQGSDQISAESGVDRIYQRPINSTEPDGSKDAIICGDGKDEIWINFSIDGDQVSDDCEIIHKG
jgi:Ca2+-binding RTX toxin-like protein